MMHKFSNEFFKDLKQDYDVYGYVTKTDKYGCEFTEKSYEPTEVLNVLWQPLTSEADIAAYGQSIKSMLYAIVYDDPNINYGDTVVIDGYDYKIVGIKPYRTYQRIDVSKVEVDSNGH